MLRIEAIAEKLREESTDESANEELTESESREAPPLPEHLLTIPGVLGECVEWCNAIAIKPQPIFSVQTSLAFASVLCGRRFRSQYDNFTSLYFLMIGCSGGGKEIAKTGVEQLLEFIDRPDLIGPSIYASDAGVTSALHERPKHISIQDEFGLYLESALKDSSSHRARAMTQLMECWGRLGGTVRPAGYSTAGKDKYQREDMAARVVRNPAITLLGLTTPDIFYRAVSGKIDDGFLGRFLIVESDAPRQPLDFKRRIEPPVSVLNWSNWLDDQQLDLARLVETSSNIAPTPAEMDITDGAKRLFIEFDKDVCIPLAKKYAESGLSALTVRTTEAAMRLSLIVALSRYSRSVLSTDAQWAIDYVGHHTRQAIERVARSCARSQHEADTNKMLEIIRKAKTYQCKKYQDLLAKGLMPHGNLMRLMHMPARKLNELLETAWIANRIEIVDTGKKGPRGTLKAYRFLG